MHPLINTWKTIGMINKGLRINKVTRLRRMTAAQSAVGEIPCTDQLVYYNMTSPKVGPPVTCRKTYPKTSSESQQRVGKAENGNTTSNVWRDLGVGLLMGIPVAHTVCFKTNPRTWKSIKN
jgi:hypothetical protein